MSVSSSVSLVGNLVQDLQFFPTRDGSGYVCRGRLVVNERKRTPSGEWEDRSAFLDFVAFNQQAANLHVLRKGMRVMVIGRLSQSDWTDRDGNPRSKIELVADEVGVSTLFHEVSAVSSQARNGDLGRYVRSVPSGSQGSAARASEGRPGGAARLAGVPGGGQRVRDERSDEGIASFGSEFGEPDSDWIEPAF